MITLRSGCKINLFLDITGKRSDGRHELHSLFWPLSEPHDELTLRPCATAQFLLRCNTLALDPEHNTLSAAWRAFAGATGFAPGLEADLHKGVPSGAGLGGGSADAASLLLWLNRQAPQPLPPEALVQVGLAVGADVPFFLGTNTPSVPVADSPFFLHTSPALATGIGERLREYPEATIFHGLWLVLVCPACAVSTAWAFRAYDADMAYNALTSARRESNYANSQSVVAQYIRNDLEKVVFAEYPQVAACKASLLRHGASAAGMSGSGASVFGLFRGANHTSGESRAQAAAQALAHELNGREIRVWVQPL